MSRGGAPLLLVGLLIGALAACSASDEPSSPASEASSTAPASAAASASPEPEAAEPAPRPPVRACYRLSYGEAVAPTAEARPAACAGPHTSATFLVGTLDTVAEGHLLAVDSRKVQEQVAGTCPGRLAGYVGGTDEQRRLSMIRAVWFTPTVEESDEGADWFRCDVIALAGDQRLAPLAGRMAGVLRTEAGRERFGTCGTAEPGAPGFRRVICSADHSWRAVATVGLPRGGYPGLAVVRSAGASPCEATGRAVAADPLDFRWGYEWPTREQWAAGQSYGICWAPD